MLRVAVLVLLLAHVSVIDALRVCESSPVDNGLYGDADVVVVSVPHEFSMLGVRRSRRIVRVMNHLRADGFKHFVMPSPAPTAGFDAGLLMASRVPIHRGEFVRVASGVLHTTYAIRAQVHGLPGALWAMRADDVTASTLAALRTKTRHADVIVHDASNSDYITRSC
jgi:hypothetical protein